MIKSTQENFKPTTKVDYPCLKKSNNEKSLIILFSAPCQGVVVFQGTSPWPEGHYSVNWSEGEFSLYDGKITLENSL